jgi:xylulokinase
MLGLNGHTREARGDVLVAIDVGTSGARASVFDLEGHRLLEVRRPYATAAPAEGWAEQDARAWRSGALSAVRGAVAALAVGARVRAIGLTGQCPSFVGVDAHGEPTGRGLIYRDNRATVEADEIRERFGDAAIHARTGHLPAAFHVGAKVLWLRRHRPAEFAATRRFLQPRDLVVRALTGVETTDGTHASATLFVDIRTREWAPDLLAAWDLDPTLFPPIRGSWEVVDTVSPAVARRLGLPAGVPVVLGLRPGRGCRRARCSERDGRLVDVPQRRRPRAPPRAARHPLPARRAGPVHDRDRHQHDRARGRLGRAPPVRGPDR